MLFVKILIANFATCNYFVNLVSSKDREMQVTQIPNVKILPFNEPKALIVPMKI